MVFNSPVIIFLFGLVFFWLAVISYWFWKILGHYRRLTGKTTGMTLQEILDTVIRNQKEIAKHIGDIESQVSVLEKQSVLNIQQVGIVRFNPFADTGGSQSFTLALLDGKDNGIVMTSLYARTGNRWYIKHVKSGKGVELELSKEEQAAIVKAKHAANITV